MKKKDDTLGRRLFTFYSALSMLLCVAVCVLWVRGYLVQDDFSVSRVVGSDTRPVEERVNLVACQGVIWAYADSFWSDLPYAARRRQAMRARLGNGWRFRKRVISSPSYPEFETGGIHAAGFYASRHESVSPSEVRRAVHVLVPMWFAASSTAILPAVWLLAAGRQKRWDRRARLGLCPSCGYDLRASPERCSECGAAVSSPTPA